MPHHSPNPPNPARSPNAPDPAKPPEGAADIRFIGNATLLIRYGDLTLLTDPNFLHRGQRAHLGYGLVSRRVTEPALDVTELPHEDLDAVVLSHLHGDHFDRVARRGLDRGLPFVTTPHGSRVLQGLYGFRRATGLRTWETHTLRHGDSTVRVTSLPGRHAPGPARFLLPPVMGSLLEFGDGTGETRLVVYLSGDTCARSPYATRTSTWPSCTSAARPCPAVSWSPWTPNRAPTCSTSCARAGPCPSTTTTTRSSAPRSTTSSRRPTAGATPPACCGAPRAST